MSGKRNKYISAPLYGYKNVKAAEKKMQEQLAEQGDVQNSPKSARFAPMVNTAQNMQNQPGILFGEQQLPPGAGQLPGSGAVNGAYAPQGAAPYAGAQNTQVPYGVSYPAQPGQNSLFGQPVSGTAPQASFYAANGQQINPMSYGSNSYGQSAGTVPYGGTPYGQPANPAPYGGSPYGQSANAVPYGQNAQAPYAAGAQGADIPSETPVSPQKQKDKQISRRMLFILGITVLVPLLFVLCFVLPYSGLKIAVLFIALAAIIALWVGKNVPKTARYFTTLIYLILMVFTGISLVSGILSSENQSRSSVSAGTVPVSDVTVPVALPSDVPVTEAPQETAVSYAQTRLDAFMSYWAENQLESMVSMCLPSWVDEQENPKQEMFIKIANRTPLSYKVESLSGSDADTSRTISLTVLFSKGSSFEPTYHSMQVLMLRMNDTWYVDPDSLGSTVLSVTPGGEAEDAGYIPFVPTQAPTDTPEPSQISILYYNPDGGRYYHIDQQCSSVDKKYTLVPFYFSDINSTTYKNLLACPVCGAPSRPLITGN